MSYEIEIIPQALSDLAALPLKIRQQLSKKIEQLSEEPRPSKSKRLQQHSHLYRIRSGNYRVLYQIYDQKLQVLVVRIALRSIVYRNLPNPR